MADSFLRRPKDTLPSDTELVRYWVIVSLSVSCILIAAIAVFHDPLSIYQQLFYIPIVYTAYYYPRRGVFLAGGLGLIYQTIAYYVLYPNLNILIFITVQVIVFIAVAGLVSLFSTRMKDEQERYRRIFESARLGMLFLKTDRRTLLEANPYLARLLDYRPEELRDLSFRDLFFREEDYREYLRNIDTCGTSQNSPGFETRFVTKGGKPVWVLISCAIGGGDQVTCTAFDISERKQTEEALSEAELSQTMTLDAIGDAVHVIDTDCRIVHANRTYMQWCNRYVSGMNPLGKRPWDIVPDLQNRLRDDYSRVVKTREVLVTSEITRFGEREIDTETRIIPIVEHSEVTRIVTVIRDISDRRMAEQALRDSESKYRQLADNSPISIIIARHGTIDYANPTFTRLTGYRNEELLGKKFSDLVHPDDRPLIEDMVVKWESGRFVTTSGPIKFMRKGGETRRAEMFVSSIQDGGVQAEMINLVDVTQQILLEEKLRGDLERRRDIITTVAHELRTPLQPIMGYLNLLIQDPEGFGLNEETQRIIALCLKNVDRERQIVNQMLELTILDSGKIRLQYSEFFLGNLVNSVIEAGGYQLQGDLENRIPPETLIRADMDRLYVVLDSILSNAVKYSKIPRKILIGYADDGDSHKICITDNGVGIDEQSLPMIFEPFHLADAAKLSRKYERIGLSLSIAKKYVQLHGGDIVVTSKVGTGSTFTIVIPREAPQ